MKHRDDESYNYLKNMDYGINRYKHSGFAVVMRILDFEGPSLRSVGGITILVGKKC